MDTIKYQIQYHIRLRPLSRQIIYGVFEKQKNTLQGRYMHYFF